MRRTLTICAAALALAACSSSTADTADPTTTTTVERTTTTLTPDEAFTADISDTLTFGTDGTDDGAAATLGLARSICDLLDTVGSAGAADAPNDTPQTDASVVAQGTVMAIDTAFTGPAPADVVAVVLRTGTEHLCPQHTDIVEADLQRRGL